MFDVHARLMPQHVMEWYASVRDVIVSGGSSSSSPQVALLDARPIHYAQPRDSAEEDNNEGVQIILPDPDDPFNAGQREDYNTSGGLEFQIGHRFRVTIINTDLSVSILVLQSAMPQSYHFKSLYRKVWMAKQKTIAQIYGDWKESYNKIPVNPPSHRAHRPVVPHLRPATASCRHHRSFEQSPNPTAAVVPSNSHLHHVASVVPSKVLHHCLVTRRHCPTLPITFSVEGDFELLEFQSGAIENHLPKRRVRPRHRVTDSEQQQMDSSYGRDQQRGSGAIEVTKITKPAAADEDEQRSLLLRGTHGAAQSGGRRD
ncbi:hypothetical protein Ahy_B06g084308 [Arachis hypogaea]|uniref:Uncharacterized protein n=1 Tax=Arachis hypogaea TaxID=3818 RepID=A0A444YRJ8_ARAHY|nr:hypothetical protein Ahy_B06g084308 [Arachis hypogaea]